MKHSNYIQLNKSELLTLSERLQEAFNMFNGEMKKLTGYKDSDDYSKLIYEIKRVTGITLGNSTLRDLITLKHTGRFQKSTFDVIEKFIDYYTKSPSVLLGRIRRSKVDINPIKQKIFWGVNQGYKAGAFINSLQGAFIEWKELKKELEEKVITQCPRIIPVHSKAELKDFYGKKDWTIEIVTPKGQILGSVWVGSDPQKNWNLDGLVRVGHVISDTEWEVWQIFQRYSDGSYRITKSFV